jgi:dTDP-glucose 4,6-dehydratase
MNNYNQILVTGADGFIGSHLTEYLISKGYKVRAFVYYNSFNSCGWLDYLPNNIKNAIDIFFGDIRDYGRVMQAMSNCDAVLHLASLISIPYSYVSPNSYVDTNVNGTLNVLQAARLLNIRRIVHTSTSEVYGTAKFIPITENHPINAQSPYSASKIAADQLALSFFNSFNTPVTIIRPFNTYGPRQSARAIIPTIITQILNGKYEIFLGSTFPTRDFNYINDTVKAFEALLVSNNVEGKIFNSATGFEISIIDLVKLISEIIGKEINIISDDSRIRPLNSEVERLVGDNNKLRQFTNWAPAYTDITGLRLGLTNTINWFKDQKHLNMYNSFKYNI